MNYFNQQLDLYQMGELLLLNYLEMMMEGYDLLYPYPPV